MNADEVGLVREAFRHLVTAEGTRAILSRVELEQLLGDDDTGRGVIEELIGGRLLVASESVEGSVQIEITHEALLEAWPQLVEWRQKDAENARLRDQLRVAARQWNERDRPRGLLWRSEALAEYKIWRARYPGRLTDVESDFGAASVADAARLRTIRRVVLGTAFAALLVGLVIIYRAEVRASANAELSENRLAQFYREQGRRELAAGNPAHGLVYLSEIADRAESDPTVRLLYSRARRAFSANRFTLRASKQSLFGLDVTADGKRAITAGEDAIVRIWDLETGRRIAEIADVHKGVVYSIAVADDGRFVTVGEDPYAVVFREGGEVISKLVGHDDSAEGAGIYMARFSPPGDRVVTAAADKTIRIWDAVSGVEKTVLRGHEADVFDARFSKDGRRVLSASVDGTARLWDLETKTSRVIDVHEGLVWTAQWSPDERFIVTTGADGKVVVSDGTSAEVLRVLSGHTGWVTDASLSPDGTRVITASRDATARVFELATGKQVALLSGHAGQVNRAYFVGPDRAVTASADASVRLWSLATGALEEVLVGHTAFIFAAKMAGPERMVTASWDGTARLWGLGRSRIQLAEQSDRKLGEPGTSRVTVRSLVQSSGKATALAIKAREVELSIGSARRSIAGLSADVSALALSDTQLAIGLEDGGVELVSLTDGSRRGRLELAQATPVMSLVATGEGWTGLSGEGALISLDSVGAARVLAEVAKSELPTADAGGFAHLFADESGEVVLATARHLRRYALRSGAAESLASAPGDLFATVAASGDQRAFAVASLQDITVVRGDEKPITLGASGRPMSLALNSDGSILLAGTESGEIEVWDVRAQTVIDRQPVHGSWITSLAIDPSGHFAISSSADQRAKIFAVRELVVLDTLEPAAGEVYQARFIDRGNAAIVWAPELVMQWDTRVPAYTKSDAEAFARCEVGWELADGRISVRKALPAECTSK